MEATFVLTEQEDRLAFAERLANFFVGKTIRVRVEEVATTHIGQHQLLQRMQALRAKTAQKPHTIPPGMDINELIDSVNDIDA